MSNRFSFRTIVSATAYGCWIASTTTAFVTPSTRSPKSLLVPKIQVSPPSRVSLEPSSFQTKLQQQPRQPHSANHAKAQWATAATSSSSSSSSSLTADQKSILSVGLWCTLDICFRRLFQKLGIASKFPSSLGGCGVVLAVLLLLRSSSSDQKESKLHRILTPGAGLLAKWLPVFFVPSLVTLPLVGSIESLGGSAEVRRKNCQ